MSICVVDVYKKRKKYIGTTSSRKTVVLRSVSKQGDSKKALVRVSRKGDSAKFLMWLPEKKILKGYISYIKNTPFFFSLDSHDPIKRYAIDKSFPKRTGQQIYSVEVVDWDIPKVRYKSAEPFSIESVVADIHELTMPSSSVGVVAKDSSERKDLRHVPFITIDGENARDFDDAVWAEPDSKGGWVLMVAIADVSHFVPIGSPIDKEAYRRGNSVYMPSSVYPMLPEQLCNDLCSLRPHKDRLSVVCRMVINGSGDMTDYTFFRAIIRSHSRLTYRAVHEGHIEAFHKEIGCLESLYTCLKAKKRERGALEISSGESSWNPSLMAMEIVPVWPSHGLIEECMIMANVAAAHMLSSHGFGVYRTHDKPPHDKLDQFYRTMRTLGICKKKTLPPNDYLTHYATHSDFFMIKESVLRAQCQAIYAKNNTGHYGLALPQYTHFTSPIRRYADLIAHRGILAHIGHIDAYAYADAYAQYDMAYITQKEKEAVVVERTIQEHYWGRHITQDAERVYMAYVINTCARGIFILLKETRSSGFIPRRFLQKTPYVRALRSGSRGVPIGTRLHVKLSRVDPLWGRAEFCLVSRD